MTTVNVKGLDRVRTKIENRLKKCLMNAVHIGIDTLSQMRPTYDFPMWTGSYMASWTVYENINQKDYVHQPQPWQERRQVAGTFANPLRESGAWFQEYWPDSPYTRMIIANNWKTPPDAEGSEFITASDIEYVGSPTRTTGWMVAAHTFNQIKERKQAILKAI